MLTNPLGLILGAANLEVGIGVGDSVSLNPSVSYVSLDANGTSTSAMGVGLGLQFFFGEPLYNGWYLYPQLAYASAEAESGGLKAEASVFGAGVIGGYQSDWRPFTLRLGAGFAYLHGEATGDDVELNVIGVAPALDASLGVSF